MFFIVILCQCTVHMAKRSWGSLQPVCQQLGNRNVPRGRNTADSLRSFTMSGMHAESIDSAGYATKVHRSKVERTLPIQHSRLNSWALLFPPPTRAKIAQNLQLHHSPAARHHCTVIGETAWLSRRLQISPRMEVKDSNFKICPGMSDLVTCDLGVRPEK